MNPMQFPILLASAPFAAQHLIGLGLNLLSRTGLVRELKPCPALGVPQVGP
jgi:hypothetical protein